MKKGFTLIELLVVIAIIAILSAIVLGSLDSARNKGSTSAVKATMKQVAEQASLYVSTAVSYGSSVSSCSSGVFSDSVIQSQELEVLSNAGTGATLACTTDSTGTKWAFSVSVLKTGGSWCIDNSTHFVASTSVSGICQ